MFALELAGLKKTYRSRGQNQVALTGIDLQVAKGQIFGFAGPNGAGKSTTIKILVGLMTPDQGKALVFEHPCGSQQARRQIGYLPETSTYHEFMTANELLNIHAHLAGVPRAEQAARCQEVLELVGLQDRGRSRIKEFSKGMKQRFGVAQALVGRPGLLILDELTSGLDPMAQRELLSILERLKGEGITVFFSSHHMNEIEAVCDGAAIIHKGQIHRQGTLEELLTSKMVRLRYRQEGEVVECQLESEQAAAELSRLTTEGVEVLEYVPVRGNFAEVFHQVMAEVAA
ncbi:MAG: ABC transporter ATP-binding protein [Candidatus Eremiobacteraeota bacterium]|nr:ABC transporter ATP-binding protein [Candidatus Eremiobacteraeota bacterium]